MTIVKEIPKELELKRLDDFITPPEALKHAPGFAAPNFASREEQVIYSTTEKAFPRYRRRTSHTERPAPGKGLRIAIYQGPGLCGDRNAIEANFVILERAAFLATEHQGDHAHILVLPELFLSGYNVQDADKPHVAVTQDSDEIKRVGEIAKKYNIAIVCPYAEVERDARVDEDGNKVDNYYDSMVMFNQDGLFIWNYRKTQLWGTDERKHWDFPWVLNDDEIHDEARIRELAETAYQVHYINNFAVGLLNCYEAEFPELLRINKLLGAQVVLIPTAADVSVVDEQGQWWDWQYPDVSREGIQAMAFQNNMFVAYCNSGLFQYRSNGAPSGCYLGNSVIAGPYGDTIAHADNLFESMVIADVMPENYGPTHPYGRSRYIEDRRPWLYGQLLEKHVMLRGRQNPTEQRKFEYLPNPNKLTEYF